MKTTVYYFSATGNSLSIAQELARNLDGEVIPIATLRTSECVYPESDRIGFIFPIYDFKPPNIMVQFIRSLCNIEEAYVFAVATYGFLALHTMETVEEEIRARGGRLSGGFLTQMPNNGISQENHTYETMQKLFKRCKKKCADVVSYVNKGKKGRIEKQSIFVHMILSGKVFRVLPRVLPLMFHVMRNGWESLSFIAQETCNG
jgi:flavodoxin